MNSKITPGPVADGARNTQSLQLDGAIMPATRSQRSRARFPSRARTSISVGID